MIQEEGRAYRAGGARGDIARAREERTVFVKLIISSRATVKAVGAVATAVGTTQEPLVQTGQTCEPEGPACISAQKWNCPARRSNPTSRATNRMRKSEELIF
jgi:hypothetical protein